VQVEGNLLYDNDDYDNDDNNNNNDDYQSEENCKQLEHEQISLKMKHNAIMKASILAQFNKREEYSQLIFGGNCEDNNNSGDVDNDDDGRDTDDQ
jgi:hypothetical protein